MDSSEQVTMVHTLSGENFCAIRARFVQMMGFATGLFLFAF